MSDQPDPFPLTEDRVVDERSVARRHAFWILVVLACLAIIVGCLMVLLGGSAGSPKHHKINLLPPVHTHSTTPTPRSTHAVTKKSTTRAKKTRHKRSHSSSPSVTTSVPSKPTRTGNPCESATSCVVSGDGGALAAVNAVRAAHDLPAVSGGVSSNAQTCAQNRGGGSTCVPHYAWTSLPAQNGAKAVTKIAQFSGDWLLDPNTTTVNVGWAYTGGAYECALLKAP